MKRERIKVLFAILFLAVFVLLVIDLLNVINGAGAPLPFSTETSGSITLTTGLLYIAMFVALTIGGLYIVMGYGKDVAKMFRAFLISLLVLEVLIVLEELLHDGNSLWTVIPNILAIIILFILVFVKDLGEKRSRIFAIVLIVCAVIDFFYVFSLTRMLGSCNIVNLSPVIAKVLLMVELIFAIDAKYIDKTERGTK